MQQGIASLFTSSGVMPANRRRRADFTVALRDGLVSAALLAVNGKASKRTKKKIDAENRS
ncbi:hypothetical protein LB577_26520 [Mesorhizobium sp. B283B1A]|uniref:hypothetical protein n=1 Tax=Mesorhizobium TaxID=68287 RepID=UPI001CD15F67|nr:MULTISPECIES: hypothetical protein [Mesorhizobium]MCA0050461.1 hypothetical protein [Mesorhizobium sp. B283B1A]UQS65615.1 hypothetical protein M5D98_04380 [Mesorhizobium opportunistum]